MCLNVVAMMTSMKYYDLGNNPPFLVSVPQFNPVLVGLSTQVAYVLNQSVCFYCDSIVEKTGDLGQYKVTYHTVCEPEAMIQGRSGMRLSVRTFADRSLRVLSAQLNCFITQILEGYLGTSLDMICLGADGDKVDNLE